MTPRDEVIKAAKVATNDSTLYGRKEFTFSRAELERFYDIAFKAGTGIGNLYSRSELARGTRSFGPG